MELQLLFITAALFCFSYYYLFRSLNRRRIAPSLPGPRGLPILGYIPFLRPDVSPQLTELSAKYGSIYQIRLGSKRWVVISSPELFKQVVRDQDSVFANREPNVAAMIATNGIDILFSPNGIYWREMRKLFVREALSNVSLQASYDLRRQEVRTLKSQLKFQHGNPVAIGELIYETELDVIMSMLWGETLVGEAGKQMANEFRISTLKIMDLLPKPNVSDFFPFLARFDIQGIAREMNEIVPKVGEIVESVIQERLKIKEEDKSEGLGKKDDVLTILMKLQGKQLEDGSIFGIQQIKAVLLDMIVAGTDTTATVVEWVMMELLDHPKIMKKVQDEIMSVLGNESDLEESHVSKLHYLDAVVKETLRLHPPAFFLARKSLKDSQIVGGYEIPQGSMLVLNTWSVHRDPKLWENASEFCPERFLEEGGKEKLDYFGNNLQYLPFGAGRRACPGLPLAERMVMYLIASLVHSFEWKYPEGAKIDRTEKFGFILRKNIPLIAVPYQRFASA